MHWKENDINSSEYEAYSSMLSNLSAAKCELNSLKQEEMIQQVETYRGISRISVGGGGVLEGEVLARGRVREGDVPPPTQSAEAFDEEILYSVYEASWFHMNHAVAALQ